MQDLIINLRTWSEKNASLCTMSWYNGEVTDLIVFVVVFVIVVVKFMTICHVERFGLRLARGCDLNDPLTPYKKTSSKAFDHTSIKESCFVV